jgi:hypothetical protein
MRNLSINDHLQPEASQIDLRTPNGGSGSAMEHAEKVLGKGHHLQPMTKSSSTPPMLPLTPSWAKSKKESAEEETNQNKQRWSRRRRLQGDCGAQAPSSSVQETQVFTQDHMEWEVSKMTPLRGRMTPASVIITSNGTPPSEPFI